MSEETDINYSKQAEEFKREFLKYFFYWPFILISIFIFLITAFFFNRYTTKEFKTTGKIKILEKKEALNIDFSSESLFKNTINLENDIQVMSSRRILNDVAENLNLDFICNEVGEIKKTRVFPPFEIKKIAKSLNHNSFIVKVQNGKFSVLDINEKPLKSTEIGIKISINKPVRSTKTYYVSHTEREKTIDFLKGRLRLVQSGNKSDIIQAEFSSTNKLLSENIINELFKVFEKDYRSDKKNFHINTVNFINKRYLNLSSELDSIEIRKEIYKAKNDIIDFEINSGISMQNYTENENKLIELESKISIAKMISSNLINFKAELIPSNLIEGNLQINQLINEFNLLLLEKDKLLINFGTNSKAVRSIENKIKSSRDNLSLTVSNYIENLLTIKQNLVESNENLNYNLFPEKERILRSIERKLKITETLYVYLLEKREESKIASSVVEPLTKVVDYAYSQKNQIKPKVALNYVYCFFLGFLLPIIFLYLYFRSNTKIHVKDDLKKEGLDEFFVSEIPEISDEAEIVVKSERDRSTIAESFRVLVSNLNFFRSDLKKKVILSTSTIKGEGKTFTAINTAVTLSTLNKKVLLIGADLRNPQLHKYLNIKKNSKGLSDFLTSTTNDWKKLTNKSKNILCDVIIAGVIPPNPTQLISNGRLKVLIEDAKKLYDYIIIDSPPCLLVSDTISLLSLSDILLYVCRSNHTEKSLLKYIKDNVNQGRFKNIAIVLNGLGKKDKYGYGYSYSYAYSYSYQYKYNYNYGYGYGYGEDSRKKTNN